VIAQTASQAKQPTTWLGRNLGRGFSGRSTHGRIVGDARGGAGPKAGGRMADPGRFFVYR
jgi:hypothetical protein